MKISTKVLLVVLPLLIFPFLLIGVTSFISARTGITKVAKEFLSYKATEMFKYCRRQEDILTETGLIEIEGYRELAQSSAEEYADTIRLSETLQSTLPSSGSRATMVSSPISAGGSWAKASSLLFAGT